MAWVSVSMPVSAVRRKGQLSVSSKSTMAACGITPLPAISIFSSVSVSVMTVNLVTSDPVPAVVGMASKRHAHIRDDVRHLVVAHLPRIGRHHAHGLGGVDGRAAAQRYHAVEAAFRQDLRPGIDHIGRRVRHGVGEDFERNARLLQRVGQLRDGATVAHIRIGHDQRPLDSQPAQRFGDLRYGAAADQHQLGHDDCGDHDD